MRTAFFIFVGAFLWLHFFLPAIGENNNLNATKSAAVKSESGGTDNKNASNTNYVVIPNAQTKTVNSSELLKVLLQEAAEKDKASKEADLSVNKTLSRKTTPTDTNPVAGNIPKVTETPHSTEKSEQTTAATIKPKEKQIAVVAESVAVEIGTSPNDANKTAIAEKEFVALKPVNMQKNSTENKTIQEKQNNVTATTNSAVNGTTTTTTTTIKTTTEKSTTTTKATTTTSTTTTTTTTTPKPKKPLITYGLEDFSETELEKAASAAAAAQANSKMPMPETAPIREYPNAEPSQELSASYHRNRDYIVPVLTIMFTIPLAMGVLITAYRRLRDYWSTRHYRRMDFLVDGMYNE